MFYVEQYEHPVTQTYSFQENTLVPHYLIRLFYVEHMQFFKKLLIFTLFIVSCNKRDPHPENKDPVYVQLQKDMAEAKVALAYVADYINTNKVDLEKAVPQSGERAAYEKRINEGLNAQIYATQQVRMYEVRIEERKLYVGRRYLESLTSGGRKWPEDGEADTELLKLQLIREKTSRVKDTLKKEEPKDVSRGTTDGKTSSNEKTSPNSH